MDKLLVRSGITFVGMLMLGFGVELNNNNAWQHLSALFVCIGVLIIFCVVSQTGD